MARKILGDTIDIHGGGLDLMFPHHENELAQSESCTGKPFARYWLHNGLMQASGQAGKVGGAHSRQGDAADLNAAKEDQEANKLAGSKGAASVKELFARHDPETVRFFLLATHYRSPIDFSDERIDEIGKSLDGFYRLFETYERVTGKSFYDLTAPKKHASEPTASDTGAFSEFVTEVAALKQRFLDAMDDDFNTGGAVGALFDLRKTINGFIGGHALDGGKGDPAAVAVLVSAMTVLKELAQLLGVFSAPRPKVAGADDALVDDLMQLIIQIRADARKNKNFPVADLIRNRLGELKITLEDRTEKTYWRKG
jgi:cysteinyl-tRNA synthetase